MAGQFGQSPPAAASSRNSTVGAGEFKFKLYYFAQINMKLFYCFIMN